MWISIYASKCPWGKLNFIRHNIDNSFLTKKSWALNGPKGNAEGALLQGSWSQPCHAKVSEVPAWTYHKEPGITETHCPLAPSSFPCSAFPFKQSTYQGLADQFSVNTTPTMQLSVLYFKSKYIFSSRYGTQFNENLESFILVDAF